ncbi:MAG: response regulator [Acidovorax sp.]|uniref:response regulator n=1 Tax=Acidovorax sp. TaxID=1872122 RepID=UPI00391888EE
MTVQLPRLLLIEPQFVLRRTMVMVARDLGIVDFHESSSVGRARALLAGDSFDGLVLDLQEGLVAMELLKDLRQGKFATAQDARVYVLAAATEALDERGLESLGVVRVLRKPVRISDLLDAIVGEPEKSTALS